MTFAGSPKAIESISRKALREPKSAQEPDSIRRSQPERRSEPSREPDSTRQQTRSSRTNSTNRVNRPNNALNSSRNYFELNVSERLRQCIESNITEFLGIPTMSGLLESLSFEVEPSSEFEYQLIMLYTRVQKLRDLIKSCDPSLIIDILEAGQDNALIEEFVVIKDFTYIRAGPHELDPILVSVDFGTTLILDQERYEFILEEQKALLAEGIGWIPVFQPMNGQGFVWADDVRKIIRPY